MRNPEFNRADAAGVVSALLDRLSDNTTQAPAPHGTGGAAPRQMSIVDFTEELLKQVARNKRP